VEELAQAQAAAAPIWLLLLVSAASPSARPVLEIER
jgi:hypothetical protein